MLAGVVKKVGVYAIVRLYFTIFAGLQLTDLALPGFSGDTLLSFFGPILFVMAAGSILLGGLGAVGREELDGLLAYSSIGQVGFIVLPLAIAATASNPQVRTLGVAAALVYALNHALAKGLLFLASGSVHDAVGSTRFSDLGGMTREKPVLSGVFFVGALSLIGIPPLSGFFGKFLVFRVAGNAGAWAALGLALVGAILTIAYFSRAWNRGFWGPVSPMVGESGPTTGLAVGLVLAVTVLLVGVGFDPVWQAAQAAADAALDTDAYVRAVEPAMPGAGGGTGGGH
jgi:multicomponent Na+:H+ antiporter subunit D